MAIPISDATDINTLLAWAMSRGRPDGGAVTTDEATAAAKRLAGKANKALSAGLTANDVDLTRALAPGRFDGMPVRAAFPAPPAGEGSLEHWTVILRETSSPGRGKYRLYRVRRAGAPGEWEVIAGVTGAQDLIWTVAGTWFAHAVQAEADSADPLQEDRHLPR